MPTEITHAVILIVTVLFVFFTSNSTLSHYDLQISAILFVILYVSKKIIIPQYPRSYLLESVIFTFIVLQIVNTTGSINSPFFFLLYFLLFSLSLLLEPAIAVTTTIALITFFLANYPAGEGLKPLIPIGSLALLTPFALYMGNLYNRIKKEEAQLRNLKKMIISDKANNYMFLSTIMKKHLANIQESVDSFMGDKQLNEITRNVERMKSLIDSYEQKNPEK